MKKTLLYILLVVAAMTVLCSCEQKVHVCTFDEGVVSKDPSCTSTGIRKSTCTECGKTQEEELPMKDHIFVEGEITTASTCATPGVQKISCSECGYESTKSLELDFSNHKGGTEYRPEGGGKPGYFTPIKEYPSCADCGAKLSEEGRDLYKPLAGYWASNQFETEDGSMQYFASFDSDSLVLGMSIEGIYMEFQYDSYEVGTLGTTFGLVYTSFDGGKEKRQVMKFVSENVEDGTVVLYVDEDSEEPSTFRQKSTQPHVHSYKTEATSMEMLNEYGRVGDSMHYKETDCDPSLHAEFKIIEDHVYGEDDTCTECGTARWYRMRWIHKTEGSNSVLVYAQCEAGFELPEPPAGYSCWKGPEGLIDRVDGKFPAVHPTKDDEILVTEIPVDTILNDYSYGGYWDDIHSHSIIYEPANHPIE